MKKTFKILALLSCLMAMFTIISCSTSSSPKEELTITVDDLPGTTWKQTFDTGYTQIAFKANNKLDYTAYSSGNGGTVSDLSYTKVDSKKISFLMTSQTGTRTATFELKSNTKASFSVDGSNGGTFNKQ